MCNLLEDLKFMVDFYKEELNSCNLNGDISKIERCSSNMKKVDELIKEYNSLKYRVEYLKKSITKKGYRDIVIFISKGCIDHKYISMTDAINEGLAPLDKEIKIKISLPEPKYIKATIKKENKKIRTKYVKEFDFHLSGYIIWREIEENEEYEIIPINTDAMAEKRLKIRKKYKSLPCSEDANGKKLFYIEYTTLLSLYELYECKHIRCRSNSTYFSQVNIKIEEPKCPKCGGSAYIYDIVEIDGNEIELCKCRGHIDRKCSVEFKRVVD